MSVNRDLAYPRVCLNVIISDLREAIKKNPAYKDEGTARIASCELGIKVMELFENYDSVELVDIPPHVNGS